MTKKDYVLIIDVIRESRNWAKDFSPDATIAIADITGRFIKALGKNNPRFDTEKFSEACHLNHTKSNDTITD